MIIEISNELGMNLGRALYGVLGAILFLFGSDMLGRYLNADKKTRKDAVYVLFLMISLGVLGYAVYMGLVLIINFFAEFIGDAIVWVKTLRFYLICLILGPFAMQAEKSLAKEQKKFGIMTILLMVGALYGLILVILDASQTERPEALDYGMYAIIAIFALYGLVGIFLIFMKQMNPQAQIKKQMQMGLSAIFVALAGEVMQLIDTSMDGEYGSLYAWGLVVEIAGWLIIRHYFMGIPSYGEFEWKSGMREIHVIMAETGISLHFKAFSHVKKSELSGDVSVTVTIPEDERRPNTDLVAGGLIGIKGMLTEISGDKGKLDNIQIGEKALVFKQGETIMCLLLCDKNLGVYHSILQELVEDIEEKHPELKNFNGDTRTLKIKECVDKAFGE